MAEISKITLPSGSTYDLKDRVAREAIASGFSYVFATDAATTPKGVKWSVSSQAGPTTITGTLEASASTKGIFYLVPSDQSASGDNDIYDEYITISKSNVFSWEKLGNTRIDISSLGALAYKGSASGSYTPSGTVTTPTITVTPSTTKKYVATSATAGGNVTSGSFTANTPTAVTLPTLNMSVTSETLSMTWSAGSVTAGKAASCTLPEVTLPTFSEQTIATGISSASSSQPSFSGTAGTVTVQ